jgi:hypothetical protein
MAAPIVPGVDNGPGAAAFSSCLETPRPGMIPTPTVNLGLPGLSAASAQRGGKRKNRKAKTQRGGKCGLMRTQMGGRAASI